MEELEPPKPKARWRNWVKPIAFTTLLYAGLGGAVYYFYGSKKPKPAPVDKVVVTPATPNDVVVPVVQDITDPNANPVAIDPSTGLPNAQAVGSPPLPTAQSATPPSPQAPNAIGQGASSQPPIAVNGTPKSVNLTPSNTPQNTRKVHQNTPVAQADPVMLPEPVPVPEQAQNTPPKPDPKSKALTKAEEDAEAQNELLREAINKVRQINDNKIAKARENTESSVPAHQPIIKDGSDEPSAEPKKPKDPPKKETSKKEVAKKEPVKQDPPKKDTADSSSKADPAPADGADSGQDGGGAE